MSGIIAAWFAQLGLIKNVAVSGIDTQAPFVTIALTVDTNTTSTPPITFVVPPGTTSIAAFNAYIALTYQTPKFDFFTGAKNANLMRNDPADATKFQVAMGLRIVYPAMSAHPNKIAGTKKLPIVLLNHGQHGSWEAGVAGSNVIVTKVHPSLNGYAYLQETLAANGIISVSVDHNFACFGNLNIETRADTIIAALDFLAQAATTTTSPYFNRIDFTRIGLMGHSRGGDAVVKATKKLLADPVRSTKFPIKTVCSLAPTDLTGADAPDKRTFLDQNDINFYLVIYGALDGDVYGDGANSFGGTGFRHYDRARPQKAMVFLDNCCHNAFNSVWWSETHDSSDARLASEADHQSLAIDYIGDLFRWQLNGENLGGRFDGRTPNRAGQHASLQWMFGRMLLRIEDFESPTSNLAGGTRTLQPPGSSPPTTIEDFASIRIGGTTLENHTSHQGHVLHVDLTGGVATGTRAMVTTISPADADWSALDTLIFSLSGWFDPTTTATIAATKLPRIKIALIDTASATSATIDSTVYGALLPSVPIFKVMNGQNVTLMRLETIPVALTAFSGVDLTKIAQIAVDIEADNGTHIFFDNVHALARA